MTLVDNTLLGAYPRTSAGFLSCLFRRDRAEEARATREALDQLAFVGLGDKATELAGNLPLGNQRVLEIARALAADPILIVLDEPAAGLRKGEKELKAFVDAALDKLRADGFYQKAVPQFVTDAAVAKITLKGFVEPPPVK